MTTLLKHPILRAWFDALNFPDRVDPSRPVFAPDLVVKTFPHGRSGRAISFRGIDAFVGWIQRMPADRFVFLPLSADHGDLIEDLPAAPHALHIRYQVSSNTAIGPWTHHGNTILHHDNDTLIAVQHGADDPPVHESIFWGLDPEIYEARKAEMIDEARRTGTINVEMYLGRGDMLKKYDAIVGHPDES